MLLVRDGVEAVKKKQPKNPAEMWLSPAHDLTCRKRTGFRWQSSRKADMPQCKFCGAKPTRYVPADAIQAVLDAVERYAKASLAFSRMESNKDTSSRRWHIGHNEETRAYRQLRRACCALKRKRSG